MSSVVVPTRHYAAGSAPDRSYYRITVQETRIKLMLAAADLSPDRRIMNAAIRSPLWSGCLSGCAG